MSFADKLVAVAGSRGSLSVSDGWKASDTGLCARWGRSVWCRFSYTLGLVECLEWQGSQVYWDLITTYLIPHYTSYWYGTISL